ncbi:MAG: MvaI/BcnI family restriction endonuclease, partial [Patescibacteria group bacterium]
PYWGFDDLEHKAGTKLLNTFYVQAEVKTVRKKEQYHYTKVMMLQKFNFEGFLKALEEGKILVDFDARTGHNHGTKFRMKQDCLPMLYNKAIRITRNPNRSRKPKLPAKRIRY